MLHYTDESEVEDGTHFQVTQEESLFRLQSWYEQVRRFGTRLIWAKEIFNGSESI